MLARKIAAATACVGFVLTSSFSAGGVASGGEGQRYPLIAVDAKSGEVRWRYDPPGNRAVFRSFTSGPTVFVASASSCEGEVRLAALDAKTRQERWHKAVYPVGTAEGGVLVVRSANGTEIQGLDPESGDELWKRTLKPSESPMTVGPALVFVLDSTPLPPSGSRDAAGLRAFNKRDGTPAWIFESGELIDHATGGFGVLFSDTKLTVLLNTDLHKDDAGNPVFGGDVLRVLDTRTGREMVHFGVGQERGSTIVGDTVVSSDGRSLTARAVATGAVRWKVDSDMEYVAGASRRLGLLVVAGGTAPTRALALHDGGTRWTATSADIRVMAVGDRSVIATNVGSSRLMSLETKTGRQQWEVPIPEDLGGLGSISTGGGAIYLAWDCSG